MKRHNYWHSIDNIGLFFSSLMQDYYSKDNIILSEFRPSIMFIKMNVSYKYKNNKLLFYLKKRNRFINLFLFEKRGVLAFYIKPHLKNKLCYSLRCYLNGEQIR